MGQKTNPNILRLGTIKDWKSKYIEKKTTESPTIIFRELEIRKFILQLFAQYELGIHNCRIYYTENSLHIYISYYNSLQLLSLTHKIKTQYTSIKSKKFQKKKKTIKKMMAKKRIYMIKTRTPLSKTSALQNQYLLSKKTHRLNTVKDIKTYVDEKSHKTLSQQKANLFLSKILKSLNLFTNKKHNIFLNLRQINKEITFLQTMSEKKKERFKESVTKLRKFQQNDFFNKGFNMLYNFITNKQDPLYLANFTATYLKRLKRPNFFLRFLKLALKTLITGKLSSFERIQIKIKGRFNGAPRSTHKFINIGKNIPVLTLNSEINYAESTAYTSNGTFGVKVWVYTTATKNYYV